MPLIAKRVKRKARLTISTNPLSEKIGIMRQGVREIIGAKQAELERVKRKTDEYIKMRREKNAKFVPQSQSWAYLKDPVYSAIVEHIKRLTKTVEENYFGSVIRHEMSNKKNGLNLRITDPRTLDSFREKNSIREAKFALEAIESRKMTEKEYENWIRRLNVKIKD
jgi:hypothetical protein